MLRVPLSLVSRRSSTRLAGSERLRAAARSIESVGHTCCLRFLTSAATSNVFKVPEVYSEAAKSVLPQLQPINPLLYDAKGSPTLEFFLQAKEKYPNCLILCRIGTFYEAFGVDALLLIEHAGLAPVGNRPKAGLPRSRLQAALNRMTALGYSIAIFEEASYLGDPGKNTRKRTFSQIVSPENPVYLPHLEALSKNDIVLENMPPIVAVSQSASDGFSVSQIFLGQRRVLHYSNLTLETAASMVDTSMTKLVLIQGSNLNVGKLISRCNVANTQVLHGHDSKSFHDAALSAVMTRLCITKPFQKFAKKLIAGQMFPLSYSTATQLGLVKHSGSQNMELYHKLHEMVLPKGTPQYCCNFIKLLMLNPPPVDICNSIRVVTKLLSARKDCVQFVRPLVMEKCHLLLESGKANRTLYRDIRSNLKAFLHYIKTFDPDLLSNALKITAYETFTETRSSVLAASAKKCLDAIESTVECDESPVLIPRTIPILDSYFEGQETFRGIVKRKRIEEIYRLVDTHAYRLILKIISEMTNRVLDHKIEDRAGISKEFEDREKDWIRFLIENLRTSGEMIYTKKHAPGVDTSRFIQLKNVYSRAIKGAKTTKLVEAANMDYLVAAREAREKVTDIMIDLSNSMIPFLPLLHTVSYFNLLIQTLTLHASHALACNWSLIKPSVRREGGIRRVFYLENFNPFYTNSNGLDITIQGVVLLSGSNMAGKSTICRSVLAIAILSNLGLYCPCGTKSIIPRFDSISATSSIAYDVPTSGKSLHVQQLEDIGGIVAGATENALVVADEPCKGSTPKSSAALTASVAEHLSNLGAFAIISTHLLDEISSLPLETDGTIEYYAARAVNMGSDVCPRWYYQLLPGRGEGSGSIRAAELAGLDNSIIQRARKFEVCLMGGETTKNGGETTKNGGETAKDRRETAKDRCYHLKTVTHVIKSILGDSMDMCVVENDEIPPPSFSRRPVLYALVLPVFSGQTLLNHALYIGESGNVGTRLRQHYKKGIQTLETMNEDAVRALGISCDEIRVDWSGYTGVLAKFVSRHMAKRAETETIKTIQATFPDIILLSVQDRLEVSTVE